MLTPLEKGGGDRYKGIEENLKQRKFIGAQKANVGAGLPAMAVGQLINI
ncbi:hypothetical protein [Pseudomonas brenneri]